MSRPPYSMYLYARSARGPPYPIYLYARYASRPPYPIYMYARYASRPPYPIYLYARSARRPPCPIYLCAGSAGRPPYPIYLYVGLLAIVIPEIGVPWLRCKDEDKSNVLINTLPACIHLYGCNNQKSEVLKKTTAKEKKRGTHLLGQNPPFSLARTAMPQQAKRSLKKTKKQNQRRVTYQLGQQKEPSVPYTRWIFFFLAWRTAMPQQVKRSYGS